MQHPRLLPLLLSLLVLAACGEDQPPTAPTPPAGLGGPAFSQTASLKVVNSLADPGDGTCNAAQCTLREAINASGSTEISFASGLTGPITLASPAAGGGTLQVEKTLTITGPGTGIVIRRRSTDPAFRIFRIGSGATVTLANLTIRNGRDYPGGGIVNRGTLELTNCTVSDNSGDGIANFARLTLRHSTAASNTFSGIFNYTDGTLTLRHSAVVHNGFGIFNKGGDLALTRSTVSENSGGGIVTQRGRVTLTEARIAANNGTGISADHASVALTNSTVARNNSAGDGGGIYNETGGVTIARSTITNNSATGQGGGIFNTVDDPYRRHRAGVTLTNSTVSGNSAGSGGGISNSPRRSSVSLTLTNSTVARNSATQEGGGIFQRGLNPDEDVALLGLTNSLVAQNSAPIGPDVFNSNVEAGFVFARFNLIGDGSGSGVSDGVDGNQVGSAGAPIDPKLGPLADNGGPTRTHALLLGSPAIDAASTPDCPPTDQRGVLRPQGAACDIGSYERQ
jgi:CSLREA domain-containing protein